MSYGYSYCRGNLQTQTNVGYSMLAGSLIVAIFLGKTRFSKDSSVNCQILRIGSEGIGHSQIPRKMRETLHLDKTFVIRRTI